MLVKLNPDVGFINIFQADFLSSSFLKAFLNLKPGIVIFWQKNIFKKAAHKMLVKLTTDVNIINILQADLLTIYLGGNSQNFLEKFLRFFVTLGSFM